MAEIHANWHAMNAGGFFIATFEYPLYSDASVSYSIEDFDSPYHLLDSNAVSTERNVALPSIYLRAKHYKTEDEPSPSVADPQLHHGGTLADEIAALLSLSGGVRVKAGGATRRFADSDRYGQIMHWDYRPLPGLIVRRHHDMILPTMPTNLYLNLQRHVTFIDHLTRDACAALVKSARLYQDALWLAESEPALSWLMMVAALETAANHWRSAVGTPEQRLMQSKRKLGEMLVSAGGIAHLRAVALEIEHTLGATKKFIDFVIAHLPAPPERRPDASYQVDWKVKPMKATLSSIYKYRSDALHGGIPFPAPMCAPPQKIFPDGWYEERPIMSLRSPVDGKIWTKSDAVMTLDVFSYITQRVLTKWWKTMSPWGLHPDDASDKRDAEYWTALGRS
jgi:hypothetical protein